MAVYFEGRVESMFKKKEDKLIAYAIIDIINKTNEIENFNKKAIYILLREMTGLPTTKVTKVINIMKLKYRKLKETFDSKGTIFI